MKKRVMALLMLFTSIAVANTADEHAKPLVAIEEKIQDRVAIPRGDGPFPVVIFSSNCGGYDLPDISNGYHRHTARLVKKGYAVVWNDYLRKKKLRDCSSADFGDWAADILNTTNWLLEQEWALKEGVHLVGFSAGATAASIVLASSGTSPTVYKNVTLMYPSCGSNRFSNWSSTTPVKYYVGSKEYGQTTARECELAMRAVDKNRLTIRVFPGAYHGFDLYEEGSLAIDGQSNESQSAKAAILWWTDFLNFLKSSQ